MVHLSDSQSALVQVAEADLHAVAGLLKMYLRDLPEPLFTDDHYPQFLSLIHISEPRDGLLSRMPSSA